MTEMKTPDFISRRDKDAMDSVEFYGDLKNETARAMLFYDGLYEIWLPKSHIVEYERVTEITYKVTVTRWIAKEKGII